MRIGFISTYPPIECGIATYTAALNDQLKAEKLETFVISPMGAQGRNVFPVFPPGSAAFAPDTFAVSIRMTPDVMHMQHEYGLYGAQKGVEAIDLLLRYRLSGVPVVTTLHTVYAELNEEERLLLKYIVQESAAVIVHEEFQKEALCREFGAQEKIHVIEHGIRVVKPIADAKKKLGLSGHKVILLSGYFRPTKGFHKIVDLFPKIAEQDADAVLVVAGKARNIEFDDYRQQLFAQLNRSPYADRIHVLYGQFPQYTFDTILSAADVVVLPYEKGAQSGILSHSLAHLKPVVVSDLQAFRSLIGRSGGGLICSDDADYPALILKLLNDPQRCRKYQQNIRRYVREQASWKHIARVHMKVYRSVMTAPTPKARYVYLPEPEDRKQKTENSSDLHPAEESSNEAA